MSCFFRFNFLCVRSFSFRLTPSCASLSKISLSLVATVSQPPHETGFPLCLCPSVQFVCCSSLCICVLVPSPFLHTAISLLSVIHHLTTIRASAPPLWTLASRAEWSILPHLTVFREDRILDMSMTHLCRRWFTYTTGMTAVLCAPLHWK